MKPENIDLFVDRICGLFPTDNIARNTVKKAWSQDDFLLDTEVEVARLAAKKIESEQKFPTLARVKQIIREITRSNEKKISCPRCNGDGWDTGIIITEGPHGQVVRRWVYTEQWEGKTYSVVKKCQCRSEYKDYEQTALDLPHL
jgi:hypothetical protein